MRFGPNFPRGSESPSRIQRVRHELMRRELTVSRIETPSPGFRTITLTGDSLDSFVSLSFDDHVKFFIGDGPAAYRRDFTPRHFNHEQRTLTLEFALHPHGPASDWARNAQVGDAAVVGGPKGSLIIPTDFDWHLLVGDGSALPAIHRRLEELPAGANVHAIIQVDSAADERRIQTAASAHVQWVHSDAALLEAVANWQRPQPEDLGQEKGQKPSDGFAWAAGEASVMTQVRQTLLQHHAVPLGSTRISAYWKRGSADFHENL